MATVYSVLLSPKMIPAKYKRKKISKHAKRHGLRLGHNI
jgi:hypothetical protein